MQIFYRAGMKREKPRRIRRLSRLGGGSYAGAQDYYLTNTIGFYDLIAAVSRRIACDSPARVLAGSQGLINEAAVLVFADKSHVRLVP